VTDNAPAPARGFWGQIWVNTASWLIVCGVAGVAYIAFTVPRMLDSVLANQEQVKSEAAALRAQLLSHETRIMRLEAIR
jgi:hypothetical protein